MPTEYYVGIAIALIVIFLLALILKPRRRMRPVLQQKTIDPDQLVKQLSRIADSLEILVARFGPSPAAEKPPAVTAQIESQPEEPPTVKAQIEKQPEEPPTVNMQIEKQPEEPPVPPPSASEPSNPNEGS